MSALKSIGLVVIILLAAHILLNLYRQYYFRKLQKDMLNLNSSDFEKKIGHLFASVILPPYTIRMMILERADLKGDGRMEEEMLEELNHRHLNVHQKADVYMRGFNYYLAEKDVVHCAEYRDKINSLPDHDQMKTYVNRTYDIVLNGRGEYLDDLLKEYEHLPEEMKSGCEYLIACSYENKNDSVHAEKYEKLSRMHMHEMLNQN